MSQEQLAAGHLGVGPTPSRTCTSVSTLATLRRFDTKVSFRPQNDPLIPCERRLAKPEISEFQEVTFEARFGIRDYDRPFVEFLVTLCRFD